MERQLTTNIFKLFKKEEKKMERRLNTNIFIHLRMCITIKTEQSDICFVICQQTNAKDTKKQPLEAATLRVADLVSASGCLRSAPVWQMFRKVFEFKMGCLQSAPVNVILHFWIIVSEYLLVGFVGFGWNLVGIWLKL